MSLCKSILRPLTKAEIPAIIALETAATDWPWSEVGLQQSLNTGHDCFHWHEGDSIGYCVLQPAADIIEILNIVIFSDYQNQGRGQQLLAMIIDYSHQQNATELWLEVRESNKVARRLYQNAGFKQTGERPNYYSTKAGYEQAILMQRALT